MNHTNTKDFISALKQDNSLSGIDPKLFIDSMKSVNGDNIPWTRYLVVQLYKNIRSRLNISSKSAYIYSIKILSIGEKIGVLKLNTKLHSFIKRKRQYIFSFEERYINNISHVKLILDIIWSDYLTSCDKTDDFILPLSCFFIANSSISSLHIPNLLSDLRLCDISNQKSVILRVKENDSSAFRCELPLTNIMTLIFSKLLRGRNNENNFNYIFLPNIQNDRNKTLWDIFYIQYKNLLTNNKLTEINNISLKMFLKCLTYISAFNNIPLHLTNILSHKTLPVTGVSTDYVSLLRKQPIQRKPSTHKETHKIVANKDNLVIKRILSVNEKNSHTNILFITQANNLLKLFRGSLLKISSNTLKSPSISDDINNLQEEYLAKASEFANRDSALHLAIEWSIYKIRYEKTNTVSTLETYHSQVFSASLFKFDYAQSLKKADSNAHQNFIQQNIDSRYLSGKTVLDYLRTISNLYKFAYEMGYFKDVAITIHVNAFAVSKRVIILWPTEYNMKINEWRMKNEYTYDLLVLAADITYYGGLRDSEITSLQIQDISINGNACDISIRSGKTNNSPRVIPFHLFAPPISIQLLIKIYNKRKSLINSSPYLPLFGEENNVAYYDKDSFTNSLNHGLKLLFGVDFSQHLLRHCFANNLLLKTYIFIHPKIKEYIPDINNPLFSEKSISLLKTWISNSDYDDKLGSDHLMLWQASQLIGHQNPEELLYTYTHVFPYLYRSYLEDLNEIIDKNYNFTRQHAAIFLPNMASSSTRAKNYRTEMTISEVAEIAWKNI